MLIRLLMLGKTRRPEIRALLDDYAARIRRFAELEMTELREDSPAALRTHRNRSRRHRRPARRRRQRLQLRAIRPLAGRLPRPRRRAKSRSSAAPPKASPKPSPNAPPRKCRSRRSPSPTNWPASCSPSSSIAPSPPSPDTPTRNDARSVHSSSDVSFRTRSRAAAGTAVRNLLFALLLAEIPRW